jgi:hypothetical protein
MSVGDLVLCSLVYSAVVCVCVWPAREGLPLPLHKRIGAIKLAADPDVCRQRKAVVSVYDMLFWMMLCAGLG